MAEWMRSRGTTRWMPLEARTWNCAPLADQRLDVVGPHAGGVDDLLGADLDLLAGLQVADPHAGDPLALAQEAHDLRARRDVRAVAAAVRSERS